MQSIAETNAESLPMSIEDSTLVRRVLSLDPGGTTGYCNGWIYRGDRLKLYVDQAEWSPLALYDVLEAHCSIDSSPLSIIYEGFSYRNRPRMGLDLTPVKLIGIIELYKERYEPFVEFTMQSAATGKAFYTDDRLKQVGAYKPGKQHGRDATRHLLQWATHGAGSQYIDMPYATIEME